MAATEEPNRPLPSSPPSVRREWNYDDGEKLTHEWRGTRAKIDAKFDEQVLDAQDGTVIPRVASVSSESTDGRSRLIVRFGRKYLDDETTAQHGAEVQVIEELYAVDIVKDIRNAPYYNSGGDAALTDEEAAWVTECADHNYSDAEITSQAKQRGLHDLLFFSGWTAAMLSLRYHLLHGASQYIETGFIFRRSLHGVRTAAINVSFADVNTVIPQPTFFTVMEALVGTIPTGEWLKKAPYVEYIGKGRWRCTEEAQWAEKWSVVYGGSFDYE